MHDKFVITGGKKLSGEIATKGAKNEALKIMAASILSSESCAITNLPDIEDVRRMCELLQGLGVEIKRKSGSIVLDPKNISNSQLDPALVSKLRASIMLAGPLLSRMGEVTMPHPGGCQIGQRPIDMFLDGFKALGAKINETENGYRLTASKLIGANILLPRVSHTVTEAMLMTAALASGRTTIKNAAMEPEVTALAQYLNEQGAKIEGAGTTTIVINGVDRISGGTCRLIPDRIETGTFAILGLLTQSKITITDCEPAHLENLWLNLRKIGAEIDIKKDTITIKPRGELNASNIVTHEYPGFVTDLQPPYTVLMTQAKGLSIIRETIHPGRLFYTDILNTMGANIIMCDPYRVVVNGPTPLRGKYLTSPDLRAGIALILAGLTADGITRIDNIYQVDRGYENIVDRLVGLGANIQRV